MELPMDEIVRCGTAFQPLDLDRTWKAGDPGEPHQFADQVHTDRDAHTACQFGVHTTGPVGVA